jgi:hypothetical protein
MHFCAANCFTLMLDDGRYIATNKYSWNPPDYRSVWTIENFTRELVILHRRESPKPFDVVYKGQISKEGDRLINIVSNDKPSPNLKLTWGAALNSTPGSNEERDRAKPQQAQQNAVVVVPVMPVVCVPWFFGMACL